MSDDRRCGTCRFYTGAGDYDLSCTAEGGRRLCYENYEACDKYEYGKDRVRELEEQKKAFEDYLRTERLKRRAAQIKAPDWNETDGQYGTWVSCNYSLPKLGQDVILVFRDTFHTHPDWPKVTVGTAWLCNVTDETPKGEWKLTGRLYASYPGVINIEDGIAWMALPELPRGLL